MIDVPVVALSGVVLGTLLLGEGLAQTEIVTDAVLPSRISTVAIEGEGV